MKVYVMTGQLVLDGDDSGIFTQVYTDKAKVMIYLLAEKVSYEVDFQ